MVAVPFIKDFVGLCSFRHTTTATPSQYLNNWPSCYQSGKDTLKPGIAALDSNAVANIVEGTVQYLIAVGNIKLCSTSLWKTGTPVDCVRAPFLEIGYPFKFSIKFGVVLEQW
jgi:hypothetical protein